MLPDLVKISQHFERLRGIVMKLQQYVMLGVDKKQNFFHFYFFALCKLIQINILQYKNKNNNINTAI